jgi:hypothetical protein
MLDPPAQSFASQVKKHMYISTCKKNGQACSAADHYPSQEFVLNKMFNIVRQLVHNTAYK